MTDKLEINAGNMGLALVMLHSWTMQSVSHPQVFLVTARGFLSEGLDK